MPARLFDGRVATSQPVEATVSGGMLSLRPLDGGNWIEWSAADLRRCDVDAPGAAIMLRRRGGPERLAVDDAALLERLRAAGARLGRDRPWDRRHWAGLAAALALSVAFAALLVDQLPSLTTAFVPHRVERAWSAGLEAAVASDSRRCTAPAGQAALARLVTTLAAAAGLDAPPRFAVLDDPLVNAFTLPDGRILIMQGLIAKVDDADEFAGVLAHEMGHVLHRDPTREMVRGIELNMLVRTLGWGGSVAGQMTALSYGRRAEAAADASALTTLRRAGLRADGLGRFFARLQREMGTDGIPAFLSDHPSTASRAAVLRVVAMGSSAMNATDWAAVREICGK